MGKLQPVESAPVGRIQRSVLLRVLNKVRVAADLKGTSGMEQARYFIIRGGRVTAYNDRISISAPIGVDAGLELMAHADDLCKILSDIPEEDIDLALDDDSNLVISSATTTVWLLCLPPEGELLELVNSLKLDKLKEKDWQDIPDNFIDAISLCGFSVSRDAANVAYSSMRIDHGGTQEGVVYSTDTKRISRYELGPGAAMNFMLPNTAAKELVNIAAKEKEELAHYAMVHVQQSGSWVHFRDAEGFVFSGRTVDVDFPDVDKFFQFEGDTIELPPEIAHALKQVLVLASGDDAESRKAEITFKRGKVVISAENDRGRIERVVSVPTLKPPPSTPTMLINPVFFMDILQRATKMKVGEGRAMFTTDCFQHVMKLPAVASN